MSLYAISDLHLSFSNAKPMDCFDKIWENHAEKIKAAWERHVSETDTVLLPGDISWAMLEDDAKPDLQFINDLPGKKVIVSGNHDYWWKSTSRLNACYDNITFIKNTHASHGQYALCGSRGWLCPNDACFTVQDNKIYERELGRLQRSMDSAIKSGFDRIILMLHFPPTNDKKEQSGFLALIKRYPVEQVIYGHLHGRYSFGLSLTGRHDDVLYHLVSADYLNFVPKRILE